MIGRTFSHYVIHELLGQGGMGEVYRATDTRLGRDVAMKVLPLDVASHLDRLERFRREASAVAALNHPNIVTLYSIEEEDGQPFFTMELVEGKRLDAVLPVDGLPVMRALELMIPLTDALVAAHEKGIIHRDLKPGNVMVTQDGRVKVLDFGLAKLTAEASDADDAAAATVAAPISTPGQVVGTVPYMAPEQVRGEEADARTDVFATGILLYELLTGARPFGGESSADVMSAILRDTPAAPTRIRSELPPDLDRIVGRCLEKERGRRLQTMRDLRNELELVKRAIEKANSASGVVESAPASPPAPISSSPASTASGAGGEGDRSAPSVAVLPFVNRSRDEEDEIFTDGLADELISVLARIRGLKVAARTSSFRFKGKNDDVTSIGAQLGVATCLEGSVRKAGKRMRVAVQLVSVADGFPLWSETYDRTLDDIFAVQDDIARSVVKELRAALFGEGPDSGTSGELRAEVAEAARGRGTDSEAHRLYLQGAFLVRQMTADGVQRAVDFLRRAVTLDPGHALAWAWLSRGMTLLAGWALVPVVEGGKAALEAAERALDLEPNLPIAHVALGLALGFHARDWKRARAGLERALELAPQDQDVRFLEGLALFWMAELQAAIRILESVTNVDPLNVLAYGGLGRAYRCAGRLDDAEAAFRKELELSGQGGVSAHMRLSLVYVSLGRLDEALETARTESAPWARDCALAIVHWARGERAESEATLQTLIEREPDHAPYQIALAYGFREDEEKVFEWLERAYVESDSGLTLLKSEPFFRFVHDDPRWARMLKKVGLAD